MKKRKESKSEIAQAHGIGTQNERSLHAALKQWYARPGDQLEVRVDGFIIDIVRGDRLIEIQTRHLGALRHKLAGLLDHHPIQLVYPIAQEKWIVRTNRTGKRILGRRKSPKVGRLVDLFDELVSIPELVNHKNFILQVALIQEEETRRADGRGSWRRHGQSIHDHKLLAVLETITFESKDDFRQFLPSTVELPFSNRQLAQRLGVSIYTARRMTFCLKKMGLIAQVGKLGNQHLFEIAAESKPGEI